MKTIFQYLIGLIFSLLTLLFCWLSIIIFPNIGWHFLTVLYISIFVLQILFYYLTTDYGIKWNALSFIINFIIWVFQQVQLENYFQDTFIYKEQSKIMVYLLGGFLWVTNKILIDKVIKQSKT